MPDAFDIRDSVFTTEPPAEYADVHRVGMKWPVAGTSYKTTTRLLPADWAAIQAQFRGLRTIDGFDYDSLDPTSPLFLATAIVSAIGAALPGVVADQMPVLADLLDTDADLIAALQAAIPLNLNASNLTSGTVPDARLPARLGLYCSTITDWNDATSNGYYKGNNAANAPGSGLVGTTAWLYGHVIAYASTYAIQYVWPASAPITDADTRHAMRIQDNGVWGPWFKVMKSQAELDARYAKLAGALLQDFNVNSLVSNSGIIRKPGTAGEITLYGGTGPGDGSYIRTFGGTNATYPHEIWLAANGTIVGKWNNAASQWTLGSPSWPANLVLNSTGIYWGGNLVRHAGNTPDGSVALAQAGSDTTTRVWGADDLKAAAQTWGGGIGSGQTRTAPTYAAMTSYQNSTGRPIAFTVRNSSGNMSVDYSPDNVNWTRVAWQANSGSAVTVIIKNGEYYRFTNAPDEVTLLS